VPFKIIFNIPAITGGTVLKTSDLKNISCYIVVKFANKVNMTCANRWMGLKRK